LAETNLAAMPDALSDEPDDEVHTESLWWQSIRRQLQQFNGGPGVLVDTVGRAMKDRLTAVLDRYGADVTELETASSGAGPRWSEVPSA